MQLHAKRLLLLFVTSTLLSCKEYKAPKVELCGVNPEGDASCNDQRRVEGSQDYTRSLGPGDLCTNASDFALARGWCAERVTDLIKCEKNLKRLERRCR